MSSSKPGSLSESNIEQKINVTTECTSTGGGYAFLPLDLNFDLLVLLKFQQGTIFNFCRRFWMCFPV